MAIVTRDARNNRTHHASNTTHKPTSDSHKPRFFSSLALALFLCSFLLAETAAAATLSNASRRAYLYYYAPLILKEAQETARNPGMDWITNFDFDRDGIFGNNGRNWTQNIGQYSVSPLPASVANWKIRPTLYTGLIEFQQNGSKSLILLYHVYHAVEQGSQHDWERVELRIDNVQGTPGGAGEVVRYVVYTEHTIHAVMYNPPESAFTPRTATGYHPLLWQARWVDSSKPDKNQLLRLTTTWSALHTANQCASGSCPAATVGVAGYSKQPVHYVFVPQADAQQVAYWHAAPITAANAADLGAGQSAAPANWSDVKRITYELQDLADILPTHADLPRCADLAMVGEYGWKPWSSHWEASNNTDIMMDSPIRSETGAMLVPASSACINANPVLFHRYTVNDPDDAQGYPHKHWFWGTYLMNGEGSDLDEKAFSGGTIVSNTTGGPQKRLCASGYRDYWCQHDYYAHTGKTTKSDHGRWLPIDWHLDVNSGFDGRWVQLFTDNH